MKKVDLSGFGEMYQSHWSYGFSTYGLIRGYFGWLSTTNGFQLVVGFSNVFLLGLVGFSTNGKSKGRTCPPNAKPVKK